MFALKVHLSLHNKFSFLSYQIWLYQRQPLDSHNNICIQVQTPISISVVYQWYSTDKYKFFNDVTFLFYSSNTTSYEKYDMKCQLK